MTVKKGIEKKWVVITAAAYLLIMLDLLPSQRNAALLPAQHLPDVPDNKYHEKVHLKWKQKGKTGFPRKALGVGVKLKGAISLDSYVDFGKKKKRRKALESRRLRASPIVYMPSPLRNIPFGQSDPEAIH